MTEFQRLFLVQGRADFTVFEQFAANSQLPACHALHYLQMAAEMLGKAHAWKHEVQTTTHRAFVGFLRSLQTNRLAQKLMGFEGRNQNWRNVIRKSVPLAEAIEDLAPSLAGDGPNPEYPWPRNAPEFAPAEFPFPLWRDLTQSSVGRHFLHLVGRLFADADSFL